MRSLNPRRIVIPMRAPLLAAISLPLLLACADSGPTNVAAPELPTPPANRAAARDITQSQASPAPEAIVVYPSHGMAKRIEGRGLTSRVVGSVAATRGLSQASLDSMRRALVHLGTASKRGQTSVALMLQVIDAFAAATDAEFHERIARLPVTVSEWTTQDEHGRSGVQRDYYVKGVRKLSLFMPATTGTSGGTESVPWHEDIGAKEDGDSFGAATVLSVGLDNCEYTDSDYNYWYGECATQQEVDDALAAIAALDSDVEGISTEVTADSAAYCWAHQEDIDYCAQQLLDQDDDAISLESGDPPYMLKGPALASMTDPYAFAEAIGGSSCLTDAILSGISFGVWIHSKVLAIEIVTAASATSGGVAWAIFEATTAGVAFGLSAGKLLQCLNQS